MRASRLIKNLRDWGRVIKKQHIQVLLQILMCLSLRHHVLRHGNWVVSVVQLVGVKQVLSRLVEQAA